jgi:hypothetical protein
MYKLARNPLLDRPISFRSYTFDATPLLRMRSLEQQQQGLLQALTVRRRPSAPVGRSQPPGTEPSRKPASGNARPNTFWKSSKINSRIKTCISTNGTIKVCDYGLVVFLFFFASPVLISIPFFMSVFWLTIKFMKKKPLGYPLLYYFFILAPQKNESKSTMKEFIQVPFKIFTESLFPTILIQEFSQTHGFCLLTRWWWTTAGPPQSGGTPPPRASANTTRQPATLLHILWSKWHTPLSPPSKNKGFLH